MKVDGQAEATLPAPPARCLEVLTDYASFPQWWPGCESAEVITSEPPSTYEVALRFDTHSPIGAIECRLRFEISDDGTRIRLHSVAGPLKHLGGDGWTLTARPDGGTDARYALVGEMDTGLPGFLERPFRGKARDVLIIAPMHALEQRVQSLAPR